MLASTADSTIRQYTKPLRDWWSYCQSERISPFAPSSSQFLSFLTREIERTMSYLAINTIRSAVSLITHSGIGNHALITRFCKGVSVLNPPRPRYDYVWDPALVIDRGPQGTGGAYAAIFSFIIFSKTVG
ncbi:hypothetical protein ALC60_07411 [Trachymyrmex zeteki]|uniref:Uncharacterized protein n=1 Tax=Mycetomoellerius zeteki TaxID=64791 RepID=A0A151WZW4_9HYME|nr:hypothetical protein ALC60_07411 [Trachymyrmex zeteki]